MAIVRTTVSQKCYIYTHRERQKQVCCFIWESLFETNRFRFKGAVLHAKAFMKMMICTPYMRKMELIQNILYYLPRNLQKLLHRQKYKNWYRTFLLLLPTSYHASMRRIIHILDFCIAFQTLIFLPLTILGIHHNVN